MKFKTIKFTIGQGPSNNCMLGTQLLLRSKTRYYSKGSIIADSREKAKGLIVITSGLVLETEIVKHNTFTLLWKKALINFYDATATSFKFKTSLWSLERQMITYQWDKASKFKIIYSERFLLDKTWAQFITTSILSLCYPRSGQKFPLTRTTLTKLIVTTMEGPYFTSSAAGTSFSLLVLTRIWDLSHHFAMSDCSC